MKIILALVLTAVPAAAFAERSMLECKGKALDGKEVNITVNYDEQENWVDDNGVVPLTGAVHADYMSGTKIIIDRRTGTFKSRPGSDYGTGTCSKVTTKF